MVNVKLINRKQIIVAMAKKGLLIKDLAEILDKSTPYMTRVLNGTSDPSPKLAFAIAKQLDIDVDEVFSYQYLEETFQ